MNITEYRATNNSFNKTLIFHFGAGAGFFSEYNNMLKAIAYCLMHKIKFVLYSADAQIAPKGGWQDYFVPFTDEVFDVFHSKFNKRMPSSKQTHNVWRFIRYNTSKILRRKKNKRFLKYAPFYKQHEEVFALKKKYQFQYFTYDLWDDFTSLKSNRKVRIKGLFEGTFGELIRTIDKMIWVFNEETSSEISNLIDQLNLPENYVGFHMRGGDKTAEAEIFGHKQYFNLLKKLDPRFERNVFIASDSYRNYKLAQKNYPDYNIYSLCQPEDKGYFHGSFIDEDRDVIIKRMVNFLASVEVLSTSNMCIGTISSNVGRYVRMRLPEKAFYSLD